MKTAEQQAMKLFEARDTLYEAAKNARPCSLGAGLSFEQANLFDLAQKTHRKAIARLASVHPDYRAAPWGDDLDDADHDEDRLTKAVRKGHSRD